MPVTERLVETPCSNIVQQTAVVTVSHGGHLAPVTRGVQLANDFGSVFQKNCGLRFGFGFTKVTAVLVFGSVFCTVCCV